MNEIVNGTSVSDHRIKIFCAGGTIDKIYFDSKNTYEVGEPQVEDILKEAAIHFDYDIESILSKDSLDMTDADRRLIFRKVSHDKASRIIITHGTDTMVETARHLVPIQEKTIVLTGSLSPARFKASDASFNIGSAVIAVQTLPAGVYIVMHGIIYNPGRVRKNMKKNCFEKIGK